MIYGAVRITVWLIIAIIVFIRIKKRRSITKYMYYVMLAGWMLLCSVSFLFPIENLLIRFKTPQAVFDYAYSGKIIDIVYGDNSCLVYYTKWDGTGSYEFIIKNKERYEIASVLNTKEILKKTDANGVFYLYHITETGDYYIIGMVALKDENVYVRDTNNDKINLIIKETSGTEYKNITLYGYIENLEDAYSIYLNDVEVQIYSSNIQEK